MAGFCLRTDLAGVSSWVRALDLHARAYPRLLHLCHSPALNGEGLSACWVRLVLTLFTPVTAAGRRVWVGDGLKAPQEGRKMPAVKKLHQQSANNSKPESLFGHSFQAIGVLVTGIWGAVFAVPISSCHDLLWRPAATRVRFVLLDYPVRGRLILLCTCLELQPLDLIRLYGLRFKIEVCLRQGLHTLGTYAYHFGMKLMTPHPRTSGNQSLHRTDPAYRDGVRRKLPAYHRYVQLGCVAPGLLQYLALAHGPQVWAQFKGWLRTMNSPLAPSEAVVAQALRDRRPHFLLTAPPGHDFKKFLLDNMDPGRCTPLLMAA